MPCIITSAPEDQSSEADVSWNNIGIKDQRLQRSGSPPRTVNHPQPARYQGQEQHARSDLKAQDMVKSPKEKRKPQQRRNNNKWKGNTPENLRAESLVTEDADVRVGVGIPLTRHREKVRRNSDAPSALVPGLGRVTRSSKATHPVQQVVAAVG